MYVCMYSDARCEYSESMVRKAGNQPKVDENTVMLQSSISQAFTAIGSQHSLRNNIRIMYVCNVM